MRIDYERQAQKVTVDGQQVSMEEALEVYREATMGGDDVEVSDSFVQLLRRG